MHRRTLPMIAAAALSALVLVPDFADARVVGHRGVGYRGGLAYGQVGWRTAGLGWRGGYGYRGVGWGGVGLGLGLAASTTYGSYYPYSSYASNYYAADDYPYAPSYSETTYYPSYGYSSTTTSYYPSYGYSSHTSYYPSYGYSSTTSYYPPYGYSSHTSYYPSYGYSSYSSYRPSYGYSSYSSYYPSYGYDDNQYGYYGGYRRVGVFGGCGLGGWRC